MITMYDTPSILTINLNIYIIISIFHIEFHMIYIVTTLRDSILNHYINDEEIKYCLFI